MPYLLSPPSSSNSPRFLVHGNLHLYFRDLLPSYSFTSYHLKYWYLLSPYCSHLQPVLPCSFTWTDECCWRKSHNQTNECYSKFMISTFRTAQQFLSNSPVGSFSTLHNSNFKPWPCFLDFVLISLSSLYVKNLTSCFNMNSRLPNLQTQLYLFPSHLRKKVCLHLC